MKIKEIAKQIGWAGWVVVGLIVVLAVGAIVAANTTRTTSEVADSGEETTIDASDREVGRVDLPSEENLEDEEPEREEEPIVEEVAPVETMPQTGGGDNGEEFEYQYNWD